MKKNPNRLGRGLSALITPPAEAPQIITDHSVQLRQLPVDAIAPNPRQPRTAFNETSLAELTDSVRTSGIIQPVVVRMKGADQYELVAGERRWRAAKAAGLLTIPAIVRELSDAEAFSTALVENLQREDLGPLERAAAYQHYLESFGGTIEDLARRLSESRANISNYLRILKLRPEICYMLGTGELGMGQARAIAGVDDLERQLAIAKLAARRNLSVRQVEALSRNATDGKPAESPPQEPAQPDPYRLHLGHVEQALCKAVGLRVRLHHGKKKNSGRVVIFFDTLDEFDRIAERLGGNASLE
jgi:ParB family chromosome partitioning protein